MSDSEWIERRTTRPAWMDRSTFERDRLTLEALREDRLTVAELTTRLAGQFDDRAVYDGHVRSIVERLRHAGDVERVRLAPGTEGEYHAARWLYSRRSALTGPIAELERAYHAT